MGTKLPFKRRATGLMALATLWTVLASCSGKPVPGSPEFRERIRKGDIIVWTTPVGSRGLNLVTAAGGAKASVQGGWEIILDVEKYPEFLFGMLETKIVEVKSPNSPTAHRILEFYINAPFPFRNIRTKVDMTCNEETLSCDFFAIEGNLREMYGGLRIEDWGDGFASITFQTFADFEYDNVPAKVINGVTEWVVRRWADDMKSRVLKEPWFSMPRKQRKQMQPGEIKTEGLDDLLH